MNYDYKNIYINARLISFILEMYESHKFSYLVICKNPTIPDINEKEYYMSYSFTDPKELSKLYNKISYYISKCNIDNNLQLGVFTIINKYNNSIVNHTIRDVTKQMIELAKENDRLDIFG